MANEHPDQITPQLKFALVERVITVPIEPWIERLVAESTDEDIAYLVGTSHNTFATSTIAAHLERSDSYEDTYLRAVLSTNSEAPLENMREMPMNNHAYYGLQRFVVRNGFDLGDKTVTPLFKHVMSSRTLGDVWDAVIPSDA